MTNTNRCFAIILCLLFLITSHHSVTSSPQFKTEHFQPYLSDGAAGILDGFNQHEVTTPTRLHPVEGFPVNHGLHFRKRLKSDKKTVNIRRRRHSNHHHSGRNMPQNEDAEFELANYTLEAFNETFRLHLQPYQDFIAPAYSLEFIGSSENEDVNNTKRGSAKHCFYSGYVNDDPNQTAVVSLCSGMFGAFQTSNMEYLIQPLEEEMKTQLETAPKKHRVFRRSILPSHETEERKLCGTHLEPVLGHGINATTVQMLSQNDSASKNGIEPEEESLSRNKRYVITEKIVETMLTVDYEMYQYHIDIEVYVLTLMAIVNNIYMHPSIQNLIRICVVHLVVIHEPDLGPRIVTDAEEQLTLFSEWQADPNRPYRFQRGKYDVAMLLTRNDICSITEESRKCETVGIAIIDSICWKYKSSGVVEDRGLTGAFTIAHEIGHTLGARHDDVRTYCPPGTPRKVMSATIDHDIVPWYWSQCSANYITQMLKYGNRTCLDNEPSATHTLHPEKPGVLFDLDKQCMKMFGPDSIPCVPRGSVNRDCWKLYCRNKTESYTGPCRTTHGRWAEGTKCGLATGVEGECHYGECVEKKRRHPVDGGWGPYGSYSKCSLTCGGGVKFAERSCDNPRPSNSGRYCTGKKKKFRACNLQKCRSPSDLRWLQCQEFNSPNAHRNFTNRDEYINWIPTYPTSGPEICTLSCREDVRDGDRLKLDPEKYFKDGTPCRRESDDICADGFCVSAGCDHAIGSTTSYDVCGICGGDNSTCELVVGYFNETVKKEYHEVYEFPPGSTNIFISQFSSIPNRPDANFLSLRQHDGSNLLNNGRHLTRTEVRVLRRKTEWKYRDTIYDCQYSGTNKGIETISCINEIQNALRLEVFVTGAPKADISIKWVYYRPRYFYVFDLSRCRTMCRGYYTQTQDHCMNGRGDYVDYRFCSQSSRTYTRTAKCPPCPYRWRRVVQKCPVRCGVSTTSVRYRCIKDGRTAPTHFCVGKQSIQRKRCVGSCLPVSWNYTQWSQCTRTCGSGAVRTRSATCVDSDGNKWPDSECIERKNVQENCRLPPCAQWVSGTFSPCLCSNLQQTRVVDCRNGTDIVYAGYCDFSLKPITRKNCSNKFCWGFSDATECSVTCGVGKIRQASQCKHRQDGMIVSNQLCRLYDRPPTKIRQCDTNVDCQSHDYVEQSPPQTIHGTTLVARRILPVWQSGRWGKCNCRSGWKERQVKCLELSGKLSESCFHEKPQTIQQCQPSLEDCQMYWRTADWSSCSASCNGGIRTRKVLCILISSREVISDNQCQKELGVKPAEIERCNEQQCYQTPRYRWTEDPWFRCSKTCGPGGTKQRYVNCIREDNNQIQSKQMCSHLSEPPSITSCNLHDCPEWRTGRWSEFFCNKCSERCGGGIRKRKISCHNPSTEREVETNLCKIFTKPRSVKKCNKKPCRQDARWKKENWSKCPEKCGEHFEVRSVICRLRRKKISDDNCDPSKRPDDLRKCVSDSNLCNFYEWKIGSWQACSASCGKGRRQRQARCIQLTTGQPVEDSLCGQSPITQEVCTNGPCNAEWIHSQWTDCTQTCGGGRQERTVRCVSIDMNTYERIDVNSCNPNERPNSVRDCNRGECNRDAIWGVTTWGECSSKCGIGSITRIVYCMHTRLRVVLNNSYCERNYKSLKPDNHNNCVMPPCKPTSCYNLKREYKVDTDDEYNLQVGSHLAKIYCWGMGTETPREYITLPAGGTENFSEWFLYESTESRGCPSPNEEACSDGSCNNSLSAGLTRFKKIRYLINLNRAQNDDFTFSETSYGNQISFGTAGDCYNNQGCPQGRFNINLSGTNFRVSQNTTWAVSGFHTRMEVQFNQDRTQVKGRCGGYCGRCSADDSIGLYLDYQP